MIRGRNEADLARTERRRCRRRLAPELSTT